MLAYILSSTDLAIKDLLEYEKYEFNENIEYAGKSTITAAKKPNIEIDDFVICKDEYNNIVFTGICDNYESASSTSAYSISLRQKECMFDRYVFVDQESLITSTGIEDFLVNAIRSGWISSGDSFLDKSYITVTAQTHTKKNFKVSTSSYCDKGVYNLKTCLGNMLEYYGIVLDFSFSDGALNIKIRKDGSSAIQVNTNVTDISGYEETYAVDVLAKLKVKWVSNSTETTEYRTYYLLNDRTISTNASSSSRVHGAVKSVCIEADSEAEMYQQVLNEFSANTYSHKIEFALMKASKLYDHSAFFAGRPAVIITKSGKQQTIVTATKNSSENGFVSVAFGKLKVTLIDKLRGSK